MDDEFILQNTEQAESNKNVGWVQVGSDFYVEAYTATPILPEAWIEVDLPNDFDPVYMAAWYIAADGSFVMDTTKKAAVEKQIADELARWEEAQAAEETRQQEEAKLKEAQEHLMPMMLRMVLPSTADEELDAIAPLIPNWEKGQKYAAGMVVKFSDTFYRVNQEHTSQKDWQPDKTASLYKHIGDEPTNPWPEWVQPLGGHDAYPKGAQVTYSGKKWVSIADGNVWAPGVYGWTIATS